MCKIDNLFIDDGSPRQTFHSTNVATMLQRRNTYASEGLKWTALFYILNWSMIGPYMEYHSHRNEANRHPGHTNHQSNISDNSENNTVIRGCTEINNKNSSRKRKGILVTAHMTGMTSVVDVVQILDGGPTLNQHCVNVWCLLGVVFHKDRVQQGTVNGN